MKNAPIVVNIAEAEEIAEEHGESFGDNYKVLTPSMRPRGGSLGVNASRVPPGRTGCPFHAHQVEDEVFYILSGTGVLRYGEDLHPVRAGDCISCPAGTGIAHQLANTGDEDLVYLSIGRNDPNEVCVYPDSGKVMVRSLDRVGRLGETEYYDGEPDPPRVFALAREKGPAGR